MYDVKWIRDNADAFDAGMATRGVEPSAAAILELDARLRACLTGLQKDQGRRNELSKQIGALKSKGEDAGDLIAEVGDLKSRVQAGEKEEKEIAAELRTLLATFPNIPAADVPVGPDEHDNIEVRRHGEAPEFDFAPKQHFEIGEALGLMDFEAAARMSGSRFVVLKGALSRLERGLAAFMLDLHTTEFGYREISPPMLVRDHAAYGTGNLPKFADDLFHTDDGFWLIPTAEMPLTNLAREQIFDAAELPFRYTAYTPCFRSEAGAAGKDTRGMIRQHQFNKVELVSVALPERSDEELERMTGAAEEVLKRLGLHYRVVKLSSGDMGFSAQRTYDIEVWLPGQDTFREISSCSNCGDFQARRMDARFRPESGKGTAYVHTLNGSALAVGRTMIAVLENYQRADGTVAVPEALVPYLGGLEVIGGDG
jgi:seryl-tRNA synthetase